VLEETLVAADAVLVGSLDRNANSAVESREKILC
jgi:hypothetical protein